MFSQTGDAHLDDETEIEGYPKISGFPVIFKVCKTHKREFFKDYENARTDIEGECVICYPPDNDSLGG
jgi:hypothetical protein